MAANLGVFRAWYFDGRTANKHPVLICATAQSLTLRLKSGEAIEWPYPQIRLSPSGKGKSGVHLERTTGDPVQSVTEQLLVEDPTFLDRVEAIAPDALGSFWSRPKHASSRRILLWLAVVAIPFLLYGVWTLFIPAMADRVAENVPVEWEVKLGDTVHESLFRGSPPTAVGVQKKMLDAITQRLLATVPDQPYDFRVSIHPSNQINALALPGGIVVVFQGLVNQTESPEELAGVLAHEFQHVLRRHSTRGIIRQLASGMFLSMMVGDANGVMSGVLQTAGELDSLRFSRSMETEADREGMKMMVAARIDPQGMVRVFEKLEKEEKKLLAVVQSEEGEVPEWMQYLSTHPAAGNRVKMLEKMSGNADVSPEPIRLEADWNTLHKKSTTTPQRETRNSKP
ncbi:putative Peptidase, family M48 [Nitrospina gracilis 3/211]|uniref:Putative Peptidase, family M48 n=1 Tax=Nitrospina gracilis (strain 3/211) TaxID=1266370 RepID=M1YWA2_NITG3|nr:MULTISPECIES: M48 family metallopeptidase [Nitrospina]MCF8722642.1 putative Zn-dependent protease [Nitrospina sp. Nb-3]CCQ89574.1 putative Peptidase, family M48 [Nitrospina gracilis 3/211]